MCLRTLLVIRLKYAWTVRLFASANLMVKLFNEHFSTPAALLPERGYATRHLVGILLFVYFFSFCCFAWKYVYTIICVLTRTEHWYEKHVWKRLVVVSFFFFFFLMQLFALDKIPHENDKSIERVTQKIESACKTR